MSIVGVDIGGTSVKLAVVDLVSGSVLREAAFPTIANSTGVPFSSSDLAREISGHCRALAPDLSAVGVGVPGGLDLRREIVRNPSNFPNWGEEPLKQHLQSELGEDIAIEIDNDANVAALAEARFGAAQGIEHLLLVTLGTGVGGGLILNGSLYRGATGGAGEFGHVSIDHRGLACACGSVGCIEAYLGQRFFSQWVSDRLNKQASTESSLRSIIHLRPLEPRDISEAAENGDRFAREMLAEAGEYLGHALASVVKLLDIRTIVIGGGISAAGNLIFDPARATLRANVFRHQTDARILPAQLGNRAGVIGAALLAATEHAV